MNDSDVSKQLERMTRFILDEAENKRTEILQSAEEEANKEKDRLIRQGELAIMKDLEKKQKQIEVQKKIRASHDINQSRLKVLRAREEAVNQVVRDAHQALFQLSKQADYKDLLKSLALQAVISMEESKVSLVVRPADKEIISSQLSDIANAYKAKTGKTIQLSVDQKHLDPTSAGGVVAVANAGAIICSNTLEQRLQLAVENQLPQIRAKLFSN